MIDSAWEWIGPDPGEVGDLLVDPEEAGDPPGRWGVEHDRVVGERAVTAACAGVRPTASYTLPMSSTSRTPGAIVVAKSMTPHLLEGAPGSAELVERLEVLEQGCLGVDGQAPQLPTRRVVHEAALLDAERGDLEGLADALAALDLDEQDPTALAGQGETERSWRRSSCRRRPCR